MLGLLMQAEYAHIDPFLPISPTTENLNARF